MKAIRTECQLTSFRSRSDGSVGFSGVTPEMSSQEKVALFDLQNVLVEMLVYPKDSKDAEVVEVRKEIEGKSPATRLRGVLFLLWKQSGEKEAFEMFYSQQMEKVIEWVKRKLDANK
jgi:muconolactone delta-isomerase